MKSEWITTGGFLHLKTFKIKKQKCKVASFNLGHPVVTETIDRVIMFSVNKQCQSVQLLKYTEMFKCTKSVSTSTDVSAFQTEGVLMLKVFAHNASAIRKYRLSDDRR